MGLSSEVIAQLGRWKNEKAFSEHYLRLQAPQLAAQKILEHVHNVSRGIGPEADRSCTPLTQEERGRDLEAEGTRQGETRLFPGDVIMFCGVNYSVIFAPFFRHRSGLQLALVFVLVFGLFTMR